MDYHFVSHELTLVDSLIARMKADGTLRQLHGRYGLAHAC